MAGAAFLDVLFAVVILVSGIFDSSGDAGAVVDVGLGILFGVMGVFAVFTGPSPG